jgi:hypothetical protein
MSAGNACAAIGLANTNKIPAIGAYVQDITQPVGPGAYGPCIGPIGPGYWDRNWMGETPGFVAPGTSGAAAGKDAQWVTATAELTVPVDGLCDVTLGVVTAAAGTGTFKTFIPAGTVVPAGSLLWVFAV